MTAANILLSIVTICISTLKSSSGELICPDNIRSFSAGPNAPHYYSCDQPGVSAKLVNCPNGEVYWAREATCHAVKQDQDALGRTNISAGIEEQEQSERRGERDNSDILPFKELTLGRIVYLGDLYSAGRSEINVGESLWRTATIETHKRRSSLPNSKVDFYSADTKKDKVLHLDLSANMALSVMGGMVGISGSMGYLSDNIETEHEQSITMDYSSTTHSESLPLTAPQDFKEVVCANAKVKGYTHVVSTLIYGMGAIFNFKTFNFNKDLTNKVKGDLEYAVKGIPGVDLSGKGDLDVGWKNHNITTKMEVNLFGDFVPETQPGTYEAAIEFYQTLPKYLGEATEVETGNFIYEKASKREMQLTPLTEYCSENEVAILTSIASDIENSLSKLLADVEQVKLKVKTLSESMAAYTFLPINQVMMKLTEKVNAYEVDMKAQVLKNLPKVRNGEGEAGENILIDMLSKFKANPLYIVNAGSYLNAREREIAMIGKMIEPHKIQGTRIAIKDFEDNIDSKILYSAKYSLTLEFRILPDETSVDRYLENKWDGDKTAWFNDPTKVWMMGTEFDRFKVFAKTNGERENVGYIFSVVKVNSEYPDSAVVVNGIEKDAIGQVKQYPFDIPSVPAIAETAEITHNSIEFTLIETKEKFVSHVTQILLRYWASGVGETSVMEKTFEFKQDFNIKILASGLEAGTTYTASIQYVTKFGLSAAVEVVKETKFASAPEALQKYDVTDTSFSVKWQAPITIASGYEVKSFQIVITPLPVQERSKSKEEVKKEIAEAKIEAKIGAPPQIPKKDSKTQDGKKEHTKDAKKQYAKKEEGKAGKEGKGKKGSKGNMSKREIREVAAGMLVRRSPGIEITPSIEDDTGMEAGSVLEATTENEENVYAVTSPMLRYDTNGYYNRLFTGLVASTSYTVEIIAVIEKKVENEGENEGEKKAGLLSRSLPATLKHSTQPQPLKTPKQMKKPKEKEYHTASVSWEPAQINYGTLTEYKVKYHKLSDDETTAVIRSANQETEYKLNGLAMDTDYKVYVQVRTSEESSEFSEPLSIKTDVKDDALTQLENRIQKAIQTVVESAVEKKHAVVGPKIVEVMHTISNIEDKVRETERKGAVIERDFINFMSQDTYTKLKSIHDDIDAEMNDEEGQWTEKSFKRELSKQIPTRKSEMEEGLKKVDTGYLDLKKKVTKGIPEFFFIGQGNELKMMSSHPASLKQCLESDTCVDKSAAIYDTTKRRCSCGEYSHRVNNEQFQFYQKFSNVPIQQEITCEEVGIRYGGHEARGDTRDAKSPRGCSNQCRNSCKYWAYSISRGKCTKFSTSFDRPSRFQDNDYVSGMKVCEVRADKDMDNKNYARVNRCKENKLYSGENLDQILDYKTPEKPSDDACWLYCLDDPNCLAYTWNKVSRLCLRLANIGSISLFPDANVISGTRCEPPTVSYIGGDHAAVGVWSNNLFCKDFGKILGFRKKKVSVKLWQPQWLENDRDVPAKVINLLTGIELICEEDYDNNYPLKSDWEEQKCTKENPLVTIMAEVTHEGEDIKDDDTTQEIVASHNWCHLVGGPVEDTVRPIEMPVPNDAHNFLGRCVKMCMIVYEDPAVLYQSKSRNQMECKCYWNVRTIGIGKSEKDLYSKNGFTCRIIPPYAILYVGCFEADNAKDYVARRSVAGCAKQARDNNMRNFELFNEECHTKKETTNLNEDYVQKEDYLFQKQIPNEGFDTCRYKRKKAVFHIVSGISEATAKCRDDDDVDPLGDLYGIPCAADQYLCGIQYSTRHSQSADHPKSADRQAGNTNYIRSIALKCCSGTAPGDS